MIESRVATKYATALFRTAKRVGQVERISEDLLAISDLLKENPRLLELLESPRVLEKDKKQLMNATFAPHISEALLSFLQLVIEKHRIEYLLAMVEDFQRLVNEDQGIVEAQLVTARSLDQSLADRIREQMERSTGKSIEMKVQIDPHLVGGVVIILGDKIIDRSIRYQLNQLKEQMSALKVY
jgi:F-type H+-transporting ATPase subunit delta